MTITKRKVTHKDKITEESKPTVKQKFFEERKLRLCGITCVIRHDVV